MIEEGDGSAVVGSKVFFLGSVFHRLYMYEIAVIFIQHEHVVGIATDGGHHKSAPVGLVYIWPVTGCGLVCAGKPQKPFNGRWWWLAVALLILYFY
jgi:hypothetical protein